jgi:tetratricopeptide (TPR) repeat protein
MNNQDFIMNSGEDRFCELIAQELDSPVYQLIRSSKYDEALGLVNKFYSNNIDNDQNNIIKKSCVAWKAHIFEEQSRYEQALQSYWEVCQLTEPSDPMYFNHRTNLIRVLGLSNNSQSIREAENLLDEMNRDGVDDMFDVLNLLEIYVKNLHAFGATFSSKYNSSVRDVADQLAVDISEFDLTQPENSSNAVIEIACKNREANIRYSQVVINLENVRSQSDQSINLLRDYIEHENFVFYRDLAIESLNFLQDQH